MPEHQQNAATQARRAVELGATPDEVRSAVAHGDQDTREQVERGLRTVPPANRRGQPQEIEEIRMPPMRKFRISPPTASQTALMASLVEGSDDYFESYAVQAANGAPNTAISNWVNVYRQQFRETPATELDDLTPETLERADATLSDWRVGLTDALVYRAAQLGEDPDLDPNQRSINALRRENVRHISDAMMQETHPLEMEVLKRMTASPEEAGLFARNPEILGTFRSTAGGVAAEFVPGRGTIDFASWAKTAQEMGVLDGWVDTVVGSVLHGYSNLKIRQHLASLDSEEQVQFFREFMTKYEQKPGVIGSSWHMWVMMMGIANEEFLHTMDPNDRLDMIMSNIASLGALVELTGLGAIAYRLGKGVPAANLIWRSRPAAGAKNYQHIVQNLEHADFARRWGHDKVDIIQTQLPGPELAAPLRNLPDGILKEIDLDRAVEAATASAQIAARQNVNVFSGAERAAILDAVTKDIEGLHGVRLRPSMSRIALLDDESGVRFNLTVGKDDAHGFSSLEEAWIYGTRFSEEAGVRFLRVGKDGETLEDFRPKFRSDGRGGFEPVPGQKGEFFVNFKHEHYFSPFDQALFGPDTPVIAGTWMGRSMRWITTPSAHLDPNIFKKHARSYAREQAMLNTLDAITAPMFRNTTVAQRWKINDLLYWAEDFGKQNGRNPEFTELKAQFPDVDDVVFGGYYQTRMFYDTVHRLQNDRVYRSWHSQGYKTATNGDTSYHGAVLSADEARGFVGPNAQVLDAATGNTLNLDATALKGIYDNGGTLMRLDLPMESAQGAMHRHVVVPKASGWRVKELSRFPLKYIPGYFTRIYKDHHYIRRVEDGAMIDGKPGRNESILQIATTRKEAEVRRWLEIDRMGQRLYKKEWNPDAPKSVKANMLKEKGYEVLVSDDVRLTAIDREAMDMNQFRMEGRLFFDNRLERPLTDVYGNPAEIVDPVNTIHRVGRMVSRQIATEDLHRQQKRHFFQTFGTRIPALRGMEDATSREVADVLKTTLAASRGEEGKTAAAAKAWWDYIRTMEGTMANDVSALRKGIIEAAEWFDLNVGWKFGGEWGRSWTKELSRHAHKADVFMAAKTLGFLHFITARPVRQIFLQGGQHLSIQAIDPSYIGKLQLDAFSLLSATRQLGRGREGKKMMTIKAGQARAQLGYSKKEFNVLLDEFNKSGLVDKVDVHSFAGGMPKSTLYTPETRVGATAQALAGGIRYPVDKLRAFGFDMGEQYNVTTSWLLALRRFKKENGITDITKMTRADWDEVAVRGQGYAMGMDKANSAQWQYGALSVPMQFAQFTHKWLLTMLGASKTLRGIGLANQSFTLPEARKIVLGQILLFGAAAFSTKELWLREAEKRGIPLTQEQIDFIASGAVDYIVDTLVQNIADDPDLDFAVSEAFAPGQGFGQTLSSWGDAAFGNKHLDWVVGPGGMAASKLVQMAKTIWTISGGQIEGMSDGEKAQAILESIAAGFLSSGSDYLKVKMAHRAGQWTNQSGVGLGPNFEAKYAELVMKGVFGVNTQKVMDYYSTQRAITDMENNIRKDAREAFNHISRIVSLWGDGKFSDQEVLSQINLATAALVLYDEHEQAIFLEELYSRMKNDKLENKDMFVRVAEILMRGSTPDFVHGIANSPMFTGEQQELVKEMLEDAINDREAWQERERWTLEHSAETIRGDYSDY